MTVRQVVALCGGIGGAKLALGFYRALPPGGLTVVVNTGDDFEHLGLAISPDLDTVIYTLAGLDNPETGWGRRDETWTFMHVLESLGGASWFRLGDGDLALHVERTRRLNQGETLSSITADIATRWGVTAEIFPMSDQPVRTLIQSEDETLGFQEYFVARRCAPPATGISFQGLDGASVSTGALQAIASPRTGAVVICPSNPYLSVDPLLAVPGLKSAIATAQAPVIAVTPIIGGRAVKGPTAKIMAELGLPVSPATIAHHYGGLIDGFVLDQTDTELKDEIALPVCLTNTLMHTLDDRVALARVVCAFALQLDSGRHRRRTAR